MGSENLTGADNQQGSRESPSWDISLTPQRLHAELLAVGTKGLEAYLQGALRDGTRSARHGTHRIGQREREWILLLQAILDVLRRRGWVYREGKNRSYWIVETTAQFLSLASKKAPADFNQDEDIVHAPWRHGELREQGSRTGRCGWITSFLRSSCRLMAMQLPVDHWLLGMAGSPSVAGFVPPGGEPVVSGITVPF